MIYDLWTTKETTMSHIKGLEDEKFELRQDLVAHCLECFSPDKLEEDVKSSEFAHLYGLVEELIKVEKEVGEYYNEEDS